MNKYIQIKTIRGITLWTNGGLGFSPDEVITALKKLAKDRRVLKVEVIGMREKKKVNSEPLLPR